jgi:hypothetical protein
MAILYQKAKTIFFDVLRFFSLSGKKTNSTKTELKISDVQTKLTECTVSVDKLPKINQTTEKKPEQKPDQKTEQKTVQKTEKTPEQKTDKTPEQKK